MFASWELFGLGVFGVALMVIAYLIGAVARVLLLDRFEPEEGETAFWYTFSAAPAAGLTLLALQLWLMGNLLTLPWSRFWLLLPWLVLFLVFYRQVTALTRRDLGQCWQRAKGFAPSLVNDPLRLVVLGWLVFMVGYVVLFVLRTPFVSSDVMAFWGYKTKVFFLQEAVHVDPAVGQDAFLGVLQKAEYPPLMPLLGDVAYVLYGKIHEGLYRAVNLVFYFGMLGVFYGYVSQKLRQPFSLIAVFTLAALPVFAPVLVETKFMGYADFVFSSLILFSLVGLLRWAGKGLDRDLVMSLFFIGMAATTKKEGLPAFCIIAVLVLIMLVLRNRRSWRIGLKHSLVIAITGFVTMLPFLFWELFKWRHGIVADFSGNDALTWALARERFVDSFVHVWRFYVSDANYILIPFAFFSAAIAGLLTRNKDVLILCSFLALQTVAYHLAYTLNAADWEVAEYVVSSIARLSVHTAPIVLLALVLSARHGISSDILAYLSRRLTDSGRK